MKTVAPETGNVTDAAPTTKTRTILLVSLLVMAATTVPYLYGWRLEGSKPEFAYYTGLSYNVSDGAVYLAWMDWAARGHFFERDPFTTDPQSGLKFNVFFFTIGSVGGLLHLPPAVTYHAARVILGVALLLALWWLLGLLRTSYRVRWAAFLIIIFSSGLGWLFQLLSVAESTSDLWQPEGFTFLCLYWSPLFLVSLLLMVGVMGFLIVAEQRQTWRHAVYAGICALLLGNIHTYDLIALFGAWGCYLIARCLFRWHICRADLRSFGRAGIAAAMAAVSGGYMYYVLLTDPVFASRAASPTFSPPFECYFYGYGLTLALAAVAIVLAVVCRLPRGKSAEHGKKTGRAKNSGSQPRGPGSDVGD